MIDLRSDTVTKPGQAMRDAMSNADVGDDVYGSDPTVNHLQELAADMLGKEAALFCSSGTQSNLLALLSHCERGDEYIVGQSAHTYKYEGGGAAIFGSIQPQPVEIGEDGRLNLETVQSLVKPDDFHFARTKLLCLENTYSGRTLPLAYQASARDLAIKNQLGIHLDGARVFNAAVKLKTDVKEISQYFDTVSVCLSKGLGAPVGSVLCGSTEKINKALRWRKVLGGGMRQAGIIAAGGIFALKNNIARLEEDHQNANYLATVLNDVAEVRVLPGSAETNMVFAAVDPTCLSDLVSYLEKREILINARNPIRFVTHLDIDQTSIEKLVSAVKDFFSRH